MSSKEIRGTVVRALREIAPESDPMSMDETANLREALDLDSMDFLNFIIALHEELHVDIPETDYSKVQTLKDIVAYLASKLEPTTPG